MTLCSRASFLSQAAALSHPRLPLADTRPQVRVLTRAYKLLTLLAKAYQLPKACAATGGPGWRLAAEFEGLVAAVHQLTPDVHAAVTDLVADKVRLRKALCCERAS